MNDYSSIARRIRYHQLQRSVALAELLADGFVWMFRSIDRASTILGTSVRRKPITKTLTQA